MGGRGQKGQEDSVHSPYVWSSGFFQFQFLAFSHAHGWSEWGVQDRERVVGEMSVRVKELDCLNANDDGCIRFVPLRRILGDECIRLIG